MEQIAVFVDDAEHAEGVLKPLLAGDGAGVRWVIVVCAPKLTHRIGKWTSHASREQWRERWAERVRGRLEPLLAGAACEWLVARDGLDQVVGRLRQRLGPLRLLDARRPKFGAAAAPLEGEPAAGRWRAPVAVGIGLSLVLALAD